LLARIESLYRRNSVKKNSIIKIDNVEVNINKRSVTKDDKNIEMSKLEFDLLKYLIQNQ
jgi:DNA-binding response OmpR family regulator